MVVVYDPNFYGNADWLEAEFSSHRTGRPA
jgi:hypothetical protein